MQRRLWIPAACLFWLSCHHPQPYQKPLTPVAVHTVERYAGGGGVRYSGNVEPNSRVAVAFKVAGYVQEVLQTGGRNVQPGDFVKQGDVLARVRKEEYVAKVNEANSGLAQAGAALEQARFVVKEAQAGTEKAKLDLERARNLFRTQSVTKPEFDAATAQMDAGQAKLDAARAQVQLAEARVQTSRAQLEEAQLLLADTDLRAPVDGLVLQRLVEPGSLAGPGTGAFVLADTDPVKVIFGAPDTLLPKLKPGLPLTVTTEAINGAEFNGRITNVAPAADIKTRVFDIEITIANPRRSLKPGMIAAIQVAAQKAFHAVPVVPLTAIVRSIHDPTAYSVYVVEKQGDSVIPRSRNVVLGETFGNFIAVRDGVQPGERVIVTGATLVRDGEAVRVIPE